uniref:Uncharacterized protein n=1 Tax=Loa loa TaxID=7209 RepID=A0A1I7VJT4_LOALO
MHHAISGHSDVQRSSSSSGISVQCSKADKLSAGYGWSVVYTDIYIYMFILCMYVCEGMPRMTTWQERNSLCIPSCCHPFYLDVVKMRDKEEDWIQLEFHLSSNCLNGLCGKISGASRVIILKKSILTCTAEG